MASIDNSTPLRINAECYANPIIMDSKISSNWGTPLSILDEVAVIISEDDVAMRNKISGREYERVIKQESIVVTASLMSFDKDALGKIHPSILLEITKSNLAKISRIATIAGTRRSKNGFKLFVRPDEPDFQPGLILYNAVATLTGSGIDFEIDKDFGINISFIGFPDSDGRLYQFAPVQELEL